MQYSPTFTEGIIILFLVNTTKLYVRYVLGFGLYNSFSAFNFPTNFYVKIWGNIDRSYMSLSRLKFYVQSPSYYLNGFALLDMFLHLVTECLTHAHLVAEDIWQTKKKKKTYENLVHMQWYSWS